MEAHGADDEYFPSRSVFACHSERSEESRSPRRDSSLRSEWHSWIWLLLFIIGPRGITRVLCSHPALAPINYHQPAPAEGVLPEGGEKEKE